MRDIFIEDNILYLGNVCNTEPVDVKSIKVLKCLD